jgi:sec-independent protein translocase protein TatA
MGFLRNMGWMEMSIIAAVALLFFGPKQLPKLAASMGETIKNFRSAGKELRDAVDKDEDA